MTEERVTIRVSQPQCPKCKLPELDEKTGLLNFRGYKVMDDNGYWWSHCLKCLDWF
jgi:hypothetical protein